MELIFRFPHCLTLAFAALLLPSAAPAADPVECRWTEGRIVIDGTGDEPAWQTAAIIEGFAQPWLEKGPAVAATRVKILWDREWLYFLAEMDDGDIKSTLTDHDAAVWNDDALGIFLKPSADHAGYYQLAVNAGGTTYDAFHPDAKAYQTASAGKGSEFHLECKVQVEGTINNPGDSDRRWRLEGRVPWTDFLGAGGRPAPGETWGVNFARHGEAISCTAPLTQPDMHRTGEYGKLRFTGPVITPARRWKNERLHGSPEGPSKYAAVRAWPLLPCRSAVTVAAVPGGEWLWLVDQTGGWEAPVTVWRYRPGGDGQDAETVLTPGEVVYSVEFHPGFAENGFVYFGANGPKAGGGNASRAVRYTVREGKPDPASRKVIIEWASNGHNGAAVAFGGDGMLYVTSGDGSGDADADNAGQNTRILRAKVLRIDVDKPEPGRAYAVPPDNPFVSDVRFAPETWAYGLRNPWRLSYDKISDQMWLGENGNDLWEMARLVQRGANYGWSRYEGSHDFLQDRVLGPQPVTFPTIEQPHSEFRSLTGGVVYRGKAHPELTGAYIYGDFGSGRVRAAKWDGSKIEWDRELIDTPFSLSFIGAGADGEIVLGDYGASYYGASVTGALYRLEPAPPAPPAPPFPGLLSETGLFSNVGALIPASGVLPYRIASPGWHDGATGEHHLAVPADAGAIEWAMAKSWTPPNGTALAQTLTRDGRRIETRVLLRQQGDWAGYSYLWNAAQTDAALAERGGETFTLDGGRQWRVPSRAECLFCHTRQANFALTLHEHQLNTGDQLKVMESLGLLQSDAAVYERDRAPREKTALPAPVEGQRKPVVSALLPRAPDRLRRFFKPEDQTAPVAARARSYLGVNCAHCHTLYGGGNSAMDFDWLLPDEGMRAFHQAPQHGTLGMPDAQIICPGDPARSLVIPRMTLRGQRQMPPLGTLELDSAGIAIMAEWIAGLEKKR